MIAITDDIYGSCSWLRPLPVLYISHISYCGISINGIPEYWNTHATLERMVFFEKQDSQLWKSSAGSAFGAGPTGRSWDVIIGWDQGESGGRNLPVERFLVSDDEAGSHIDTHSASPGNSCFLFKLLEMTSTHPHRRPPSLTIWQQWWEMSLFLWS